jgi:hypothetical protein
MTYPSTTGRSGHNRSCTTVYFSIGADHGLYFLARATIKRGDKSGEGF